MQIATSMFNDTTNISQRHILLWPKILNEKVFVVFHTKISYKILVD
jgi:hypothetical protein